MDTAIVHDSLFVFVNPFPNVSLHLNCGNTSDGQLHACFFEGYTYMFHENGAISEKCILNNDSGTLKEYYYPSGKLEERGYFSKNQRTGRWKSYSEIGKLIKDTVYIYKPDSLIRQ
jgi:antitoxin component YwqK of YwqJK toxin-antitoxin module